MPPANPGQEKGPGTFSGATVHPPSPQPSPGGRGSCLQGSVSCGWRRPREDETVPCRGRASFSPLPPGQGPGVRADSDPTSVSPHTPALSRRERGPDFQGRPIIAHVLHRLYLAGAEVLAAALGRRLGRPDDAAAPYRFIFLCLDEIGPLGEQLRAEGFTVIDLARRPGVNLAVARRIVAACREHRVALLHAHQYTPFFYAAMSRAWPTRLGPIIRPRPPILFTEHGRHYPDFRRRKRIWANRLLLRRRDRVTAVGHWVGRALVDNEGLAASRIEVIHNGIDPEQFTPADESARRAARTALGIGPEQPVALQVARFHPVKDHATAIRAWAQVTKAVPDAVILLAGDGELRQEAEALGRELGVSETVRFLGVRDDVATLMAAADVFVLSSLSEGISVTLLEAMASGIAVAATRVGGNGEVVAEGETGLLSPRSDPESLAANLASLLSDPARARQMGRAGRQRLLDRFTQRQMHQAYADLYRTMLEPLHGRPGNGR